MNSLHQLSIAIKSLQAPPPIHEDHPKKDMVSKNNQVSVEDFVEKVVGRILKEVEKNDSKVKTDSLPSKMEGNESIILQMNKERLRLERQISLLMKEQTRNKKPLNNAPSAAVILEKELELKQRELHELQGQCKQLQELLMELPVVKKELHKSKQETKAVSEVLFQSRKDNAELKDQVGKLNEQGKDLETLSEQYKELQRRLENVTRKRDQNICEVDRLCKLVEEKDKEAQRNRTHCVTLKGLVDRLENAAEEAERYVALSSENETVLQYQIDELSLSLETNSQLLEDSKKHSEDIENHLKKSRENETEAKEHCEKLVEQNDFLVSELDIHKMEISRQGDLINRQHREINDLKVKLSNTLEQMESIQSQQREVNEFTEEERRNLEIALCEVENQLKLNNLERSELDVSLKNKSAKYEELVEEMKHARGLLQDKQEELEATQSQAHWIVLQQEAVIAETAKEFNEIWELVNDWLWKLSKECHLQEVDKGDNFEPEISEIETPGGDVSNCLPPPKSLVQSVLEATAMRENELQPVDSVCVKLSPIFEDSEGELEVSQLTSEDEGKPPSLTEQALEIKQSLIRLAEMASGQVASVQAQNTIKKLQEERVLLEEEHKSALEKVHSELEEARITETKLRREMSKKSNEISVLHQQLEETRANLEYSVRKIETLGEQCEKTIEQQSRITELTEDLRRFSNEVKTLEGEKASLSQQLRETLAKLDELSQAEPDLNKTQDLLGTVLAEKFNLEKKVQTFKEKSVAYRMETEDYMTEYKYRTDTKIRVLEGNIEKAEAEICRLDGLVEKIRLVLHKYHDVITSCPDLNKLLSFLDGQDIQ